MTACQHSLKDRFSGKIRATIAAIRGLAGNQKAVSDHHFRESPVRVARRRPKIIAGSWGGATLSYWNHVALEISRF